MSVKRKLILDVDTGIDDALALAYVSTFDDVELLGSIGTYGNVTADTAVRNTRYVLDWLGLRHVPVLAGSTHPSWADSFIADAGCAQFHGTDGLGGFGPAADPSTSDSAGAFTLTSRRLISVGGYNVHDRHANPSTDSLTLSFTACDRTESTPASPEGVRFIIDMVRRYGRDVTVAATGPLSDIDAALTVATSHGSRHVDVGRLSLLDDPKADHGHAFLIIAGVGFDAAMIDDTDPQLKKNISWLAYFVGGVKNLFTPKYRGDVTITSTDGSMHTRHGVAFRTFMAGNCGQIPVFSLMPNASYDDGILDFEIIDTSGGIFGWANLFGDVVHQTITGKPGSNPLSTNSTMDQIQGVSAEITLEKPVLAQVDGDMLGRTRHLRFTVDREALCVRVPEVAPDMSATGIIPPIRD